MSASEQRKLAAIMFTDMVGYSALAQRDDKLALELLEEHRQLLREIFPRFNGNEIKTIGDAFLIEFQSALEAAQCAIEIQRTLAKRNHDVTAGRRIELKIGIHIGDVVHRDGDVYGDGVNIASRIEPLAGAGGICVSMDVERQIRTALEARFEKLAPTELKNISVAMDLFRIVLPWEKEAKPEPAKTSVSDRPQRSPIFVAAVIIGLVLIFLAVPAIIFTPAILKQMRRGGSKSPTGATSASATTVSIPEKSIAVLPFDNLSRDPDNAYFAEGVQDEILTRLAKIGDLKVISRTSTQHFKSSPGNLPQIARQLGVAHILEGSVQKANDQVRVNVQLINALTDAHLWAETYDRKLTDIFAVESEIAKTIAETLQAKITGSEKTSIAKAPTANQEAYELYLKGRFFWNKRGAVNLRKSIDYFQQAIEKDPNYALAYAGLAQAWHVLPGYSGGAPRDCHPQAEAAAKKALSLDPDLADARASLADLKALHNYNFAGAAAEFERVLQLYPNDATAHHWFANEVLAPLGQSERALAEMKRALTLDPLSLIINTNLGYAYHFAGRPDEAIAQLRKTLEIDGGFAFAHAALGQALELKGQIPEAMAEYHKAVALDSDPYSLALLGRLFGMNGRRDEATKILEQLKERRQHGYFDAVPLAFITLGLGDRDQALSWLEQGFEERSTWLIYIRVEPLLKPLHGDPRFEALAEKIVPAREFAKSATPSK